MPNKTCRLSAPMFLQQHIFVVLKDRQKRTHTTLHDVWNNPTFTEQVSYNQGKNWVNRNLTEAELKNSSDPSILENHQRSNTGSGTSFSFMTHLQKGSTFSLTDVGVSSSHLPDVFNRVQAKCWKRSIKSWNSSRPLVFLTDTIDTNIWVVVKNGRAIAINTAERRASAVHTGPTGWQSVSCVICRSYLPRWPLACFAAL